MVKRQNWLNKAANSTLQPVQSGEFCDLTRINPLGSLTALKTNQGILLAQAIFALKNALSNDTFIFKKNRAFLYLFLQQRRYEPQTFRLHKLYAEGKVS